MAWQSPSAVNAGGAAGGGDGNAPTGTEYTLQGKGFRCYGHQPGDDADCVKQESCASCS